MAGEVSEDYFELVDGEEIAISEEEYDQALSETTEGFPIGLSVEEKREYLHSRNLALIIVDGVLGLIDKDDMKDYVLAIQGEL